MKAGLPIALSDDIQEYIDCIKKTARSTRPIPVAHKISVVHVINDMEGRHDHVSYESVEQVSDDEIAMSMFIIGFATRLTKILFPSWKGGKCFNMAGWMDYSDDSDESDDDDDDDEDD